MKSKLAIGIIGLCLLCGCTAMHSLIIHPLQKVWEIKHPQTSSDSPRVMPPKTQEVTGYRGLTNAADHYEVYP